MEDYLVCTKCGAVFPKEEKNKFGSLWCKKCVAAYKHEHYLANKQKYIDRSTKHYEDHKDQKLQYQREYGKTHKAERRKHVAEHRDEYNAKRREYRANSEAYKEYRKKYHQEHYNSEEKAKLRAKYAEDPQYKAKLSRYRHKRDCLQKSLPCTLTPQEWLMCLDFFGNKCAYCGKADNGIEQDHVIPITKGGGYVKENIIPACKSCNSSKGNRELETWYKSQSFFNESQLTTIKEWINT